MTHLGPAKQPTLDELGPWTVQGGGARSLDTDRVALKGTFSINKQVRAISMKCSRAAASSTRPENWPETAVLRAPSLDRSKVGPRSPANTSGAITPSRERGSAGVKSAAPLGVSSVHGVRQCRLRIE